MDFGNLIDIVSKQCEVPTKFTKFVISATDDQCSMENVKKKVIFLKLIVRKFPLMTPIKNEIKLQSISSIYKAPEYVANMVLMTKSECNDLPLKEKIEFLKKVFGILAKLIDHHLP